MQHGFLVQSLITSVLKTHYDYLQSELQLQRSQSMIIEREPSLSSLSSIKIEIKLQIYGIPMIMKTTLHKYHVKLYTFGPISNLECCYSI